MAQALDAKDAQDRLATLGCEPFKGTGDQLVQIVKSDLVRWGKLVKDSGAKIDEPCSLALTTPPREGGSGLSKARFQVFRWVQCLG